MGCCGNRTQINIGQVVSNHRSIPFDHGSSVLEVDCVTMLVDSIAQWGRVVGRLAEPSIPLNHFQYVTRCPVYALVTHVIPAKSQRFRINETPQYVGLYPISEVGYCKYYLRN